MLKPGSSFEDKPLLGRSKSRESSIERGKTLGNATRGFTESVYLDVSEKGVAGNFRGKVGA